MEAFQEGTGTLGQELFKAENQAAPLGLDTYVIQPM